MENGRRAAAVRSGDFLIVGPLTLHLKAHELHGPTGRTALTPAEFVVMETIMRSGMASPSRLATLAFPAPSRQPADAGHAVRMRVARLRTALRAVGVPGSALRNYPRTGYRLALPDIPAFREFAGADLARLTALLASHPDRAEVARLGA